MADTLYLTNDKEGFRTRKIHIPWGQTGNFTAVTAAPIFVAPSAGRVVGIHFSAVTHATTTDRTASPVIKKVHGTDSAVTICSTEASFAATAGGSGSKSTDVGGTGITAAVLKTDGTATLAAGDILTLDFSLAGSNGTIGTGAAVVVDFVPAATAVPN